MAKTNNGRELLFVLLFISIDSLFRQNTLFGVITPLQLGIPLNGYQFKIVFHFSFQLTILLRFIVPEVTIKAKHGHLQDHL